jgi:hypothetical protein
MGRLRGIVRNSPAVAVAALALCFALGSGAGYAASATHLGKAASTTGPSPSTAPSPSPDRPVFHGLKLDPEWYGYLEYAVFHGIVYLDGKVVAKNHHGGAGPIAQLPAAAGSAGSAAVPAVFGSNNGPILQYVGAIVIGPNLSAAPPPGHTINVVWLTGISYPAGSGG